MKFLIIAALLALLLLLLYSKLYPYLKLLKKVLGAARNIADSPAGRSGAFEGTSVKADKKLVRCVACGTWVPAERAIGVKGGSSVYCSRECVEKSTHSKERKMAG